MATTRFNIYGRVGGWPVWVVGYRDGEKITCQTCHETFHASDTYVAHVQAQHFYLVHGGLPPRDAGE